MAKEWEIITKTNFWGNKSYEIREKDNGGAGCLVFLVLAILIALFTAPYHLIDKHFNPFTLDWLKDYNVWIFSISTWTAAISSIIMIKSIFQFSRYQENAFDQTFESPFVTFGLFVTSISLFLGYLFKVKLSENSNYVYLAYSAIIITLFLILTKKTDETKKYSILLYIASLVIIPYFWTKTIKITPTAQEQIEIKETIHTYSVKSHSGSGANLRKEPSKSSGIIQKIPKKTLIDQLIDSTFSENIKWFKIKVNQNEGWMSSKLIKID